MIEYAHPHARARARAHAGLVGTKLDLIQAQQASRAVDKEEARAACDL